MLQAFIQQQQLPTEFAAVAQKWFVPVATQLAEHCFGASKPFYLGINGCQGSGKSTLSAFLSAWLTQNYSLKVVVLSLDDFYLSRQQRLLLSKTVHPLLQTRGVPGTHDMLQAQQTLTRLAQSQQVALPAFDKSCDDVQPATSWQKVQGPVDLVIMEGWCWGVPAQSQAQLQLAVNDLEREQDPQGLWRQFVNHQLSQHYCPLYCLMDKWLMLQAPGFDAVFDWRMQQEKKLAQRCPQGSQVMDQAKLRQFIQHYQRLTEHSLVSLPQHCDWVFKLDKQRNIQTLSQVET